MHRFRHIILLLLAAALAGCKSYPEYTLGTEDLSYSFKRAKRYSSIDKALQNPEDVVFLDLVAGSGNAIFQKFDESAHLFTNLKKLTLYGAHTNAYRVPRNIHKCKNLEFLAISGFRGLQRGAFEDLAKCDKLVFLALSACELEDIPSSVLQLRNLEGLDLTANLISSIPSSISSLSKLETIDLTNNSFLLFPNELAACKKLKYIDFNNAEGIVVKQLAALGIGVNQLEEVDGLDHYPNLVQINLAQAVDPTHLANLKLRYPSIKIK